MLVNRETLADRWYQEGWYRPETLRDDFRRAAADRPTATVVFASEARPSSVTLVEVGEEARQVAGALQALGVHPGEHVVIWLPHWKEAVVALEAALSLGAVVVPVITMYGGAELGFILRQCRASTLIMSDAWGPTDFLERFTAAGALPDLRHRIIVGDRCPNGAIPWSDLERLGRGGFVEPELDPDDVCALVYTSGTTAEPKGVMHSHNSFRTEMLSAPNSHPNDRESAFLAVFPAGHIGGLLLQARIWFGGRAVVLMDIWNPERAARLIDEYQITDAAGTPYFLAGLLDAAEKLGCSLASVESYMCAAASVPPSLLERASDFGIRTHRGYGSSEHPTVSAGCSADPFDKRVYTDGRLLPGVELRLLDDDGFDVPVGSEGEILTIGPDQFVGYTDPAREEDAFFEGWFRTGDVGRLDEDGYLTITDRKKDIVIRGGENISSKEVEDILGRHPAVAEVAVVAAPDPKYGECVCAFVVCRPGLSLDLDEVREHFRSAGVARLKTPERLEFVTDFPRTAAGKIKKFELRQRLSERDAGGESTGSQGVISSVLGSRGGGSGDANG